MGRWTYYKSALLGIYNVSILWVGGNKKKIKNKKKLLQINFKNRYPEENNYLCSRYYRYNDVSTSMNNKNSCTFILYTYLFESSKFEIVPNDIFVY